MVMVAPLQRSRSAGPCRHRALLSALSGYNSENLEMLVAATQQVRRELTIAIVAGSGSLGAARDRVQAVSLRSLGKREIC